MKNKLTRVWAAAWLLSAVFFSQASAAELAVIVHPANSLTKISKSEVSDIYLGRAEEFANGAAVEPLDQISQSPMRRQFLKAVLGMDEGALKNHWSKLMFSGRGQPPEMLRDDAAVKAAVAANPRGIGYIDSSAVDESVKVLLLVP
ncbi:MAG TPA: phosphate ABC transporter substrate-binding protein [Gammaproteobacteria bacterium]